jgi:hypothetical protein
VVKTACGVVVSSSAGALAGFLMRPCCVGPAALSMVGVSSVGLSDIFISHRTTLIGIGAVMLGATMWINMRRDGGVVNQVVAVTGLARIGWLHRQQDVFRGTPVLVGGGDWLYLTPGIGG